MTAPRLMHTEAAARAIGVSPNTLRRWAARGIVTPASRTPVSNYALWDLDQLRRQVAAYSPQPEQPKSDHGQPEQQTRAPEVETPAGSPAGELVTTGEAARAVGLSHSGLAKMATRGKVQPPAYVRVGKRGDMRWNLAELRRQLGQPE